MKLSLQLFSAREFVPYTDIIARIGALGYDATEGFIGLFDQAPTIRAALDAAGMTMPTLHVPLEMCEADPGGVVDLAAILGVRTVYAPWIEAADRPADRAGWDAFADRLAVAHKNLTTRGLAFGWHNHDFEFVPTDDGQIPMEIMLNRVPDLEWEADIAWIVRGGGDPLDWIARHGSRITAAHFKDLAPVGDKLDEDGWADPGTGTMDWRAIFAALKSQSRASVLIAEHDNPADFDRFAARAIETYRNL